MTTEVPTINPKRSDYFRHFLAELLGDTSPNETLVTAWVTMATLEANHAKWNPASMTQPEAGAEPYNSFGPGGQYHVWNYASAEQALSAWLKILGLPEYAALRSVMTRVQAMGDNPISASESNLDVVLAAIATSPWTGVVGDPHLYAGVEPDDAIVEGDGGWPYWPAPAPASAPQTPAEKLAGEGEEAQVESAVDAQSGEVVADARDGKIAAAKAKIAELETHLAELKDLLDA